MSSSDLITKEELENLLVPINVTQIITSETGLGIRFVENTVNLLKEGSTIPFIARYRKEMTGGMDEVQIGLVRDRMTALEESSARRESMLSSIAEQGKLTKVLYSMFMETLDRDALEDLYLPYKRKRITRAEKARQKGLAPLAMVLTGEEKTELSLIEFASGFINEDKGVASAEDALAGARDILAEIISENIDVRNALRKLYMERGILTSNIITGKEADGATYRDYFDFTERVATAAGHRILAVSRGEKEEILRVHITIDEKDAESNIYRFVKSPINTPEYNKQWELTVTDAFNRLLHPAMETETRRNLKEKADFEAIEVFMSNLRELLMASPLGQKIVLAIDPGFRTGCKVVVINRQGDFVAHQNIYPHEPRKQTELSQKIILDLVKKHSVEAICMGNGTASRETETFIRDMKKAGMLGSSIITLRVDESGASIYSASEIARDEFPDLDITVRGAISIGRRLQDPLGELVKIDPKSLGVGQYQHDVDQTKLKNGLDDIVLSCVNNVGVELNTASFALLKYVSGLGDKLARGIVEFREKNGPFKNRKELLKVPRLGPKAFEQSAGFLRIFGAENPLDSSAVHPESYDIVVKMAKDLNTSLKELVGNSAAVSSINLKNYITEKTGEFTLRDILNELSKPGRDPRNDFDAVEFREDVSEISDLEEGMILQGVITNVTAFGAFVDIGVHQDGLVHISELSDEYVSDPLKVVKRGQKVTVRVISVDRTRKRISLSMKKEGGSAKPSGTDRNFSPTKSKQDKGPRKSTSNESNPFATLLKK
ncbi:RNA-binding transcriptional accessory protein [Myxococcota bacterium]|nr:RNA-binding transcriptional accessory protein [Myxococcota bacterium]MBU1379285.1 RNA-binding transcriptional accessory protein [Myxococcota bacterium]MBU1499021.1 RNA-binding transcriptional accessory protein [Myxococcota bacterium]